MTAIAAGKSFVCGVKQDATVACWGYNSNDQLGDGTATGRRPTPVLGLTAVKAQSRRRSSFVCVETGWHFALLGPTATVSSLTAPPPTA
ncbi:RCC1 domain-containing protein [Candidatus Neomicrothrix sp.]|uniref:RCC1 domain-containing protein n=1 Tax=Candidatus Neomicrothrix sp. TaxID=2719034 RepID=UPI0030B9827D